MKHKVPHGATHVIKHPKKPKPKHPANRFPKPTANDFDDPFPQFVTPAATLKPTPVFWSVSPDKPKEHHEWWTNTNFETKKKVTNKPKRPAKPKDNLNQAKPLVKPSQKLSPTPSLDRATTSGAELPIESTGEGTDVEGSQALRPPASKKWGYKVVLKSFTQVGATSEKSSGGNPSAKETNSQRIPIVNETISAMIERFRNASKDRTKTTLAFKRDETASSSSPTIVTTTPRSPEQMSDAEVEKDSLQGITKQLKSSRSAVPRIIMAKLSKTAAAPQSLSERESRMKKRKASRKELGSIIKAFKGCDGAELLPEPIPQVDREASAKLGEMKSELQKKNTQIKELEEKCGNMEKKLNEQQDTILKLEEKLAETQERNNRLCDVLVEKIEVARTNPAPHKVLAEFVPEHVAPGTELSYYEVLAHGPSEGENAVLNIVGAEAGHTSPATENGSSQDSGKPEEEDLPLFAVVNGEVHLGSGLKIKETRLKYITASRQEMKVARDLARHYWTPAQMEVRCVSGLPSRNPEGPIVTRERATPAKLDAIMTYNFNPPGTIVEMAVFYDPDCQESFVEAFGSAKRFEDAVWTLIEQVQVFYKRPWLKRAIHIVVTQLTFLEKPPNELMRSSEADELLKGFANFTGDRNAPDGEQGHWDVALLLTGKDLHAHNNGKKDPSVLGKAYIGGVCSGHFDNVVVEFGSVNPHRRPMTTFGLQASHVVAHELAHNLGVYHDGPPTNAECSLDRYMMGPWRTANTTTWWSNCSLSVLEQLPEHPKSTCLKPLSADRLRELLPLNRWRSWPLPGQRWDADDQCRLFLKSQAAHHGAKPADMKAVCGKLECASPTRIGLFNAGHALEGTYCGGSNWCHENSCVPFPKSLPVVPGGWTEWDMVADCSQPCLEDSVALIHMKRSCTMPARKNTLEGCEGDGVTLRPCDINANKKAPKCDRKKTNQDYINEKCAIFSQMKSELKPTGTQVPYSAAQSWRACAIHCGYHNGAFIAAKFFLNDETKETGVLPDGARCHFDEKTGAAYYCQQGLCATLLQSLAGLELKRTSQVLELDEEDWAEDTAGRRYVERFMEYVPGEDFPVLDAKRVPKADARISVDDL